MLVFLNLIFINFILSMAVQDLLLITGKRQTNILIYRGDRHAHLFCDRPLLNELLLLEFIYMFYV